MPDGTDSKMPDGTDPQRAGRRSRAGRRRFVPPYRPMRATLSATQGEAINGSTADNGGMSMSSGPSSPAGPRQSITHAEATQTRAKATGAAARGGGAAGDATTGDATTGDATTGDATTGDAATGHADRSGATSGAVAVARLRRPFVPAPRRGIRRGVVVRQPGRISRLLGRLAVRAADAASRFGARRLGVRASDASGRFGTPPPPGAGPGPRISESELRELVAANVVIDGGQRQIIAEVLAAGVRHVREVMVPRTDAIFVAASDAVPRALDRVLTSRHSRFPVIDGTHDDVVGVVQVWDLLLADATDGLTVGALARPVHHIPGSKRVLAALSDMRREGHHLAVVVDEYGGTAGIVTLEDLVEELVGEVHTDGIEAGADETAGGALTGIDGRTNLNDFAERCGLVLPSGPYETVGGFVMARLGRLPHPGDEVTVGAWRLVVTECEGRRVSRVSVRAPAA
jgi:magnesium and cobalt exporter, CNNM family